MRKRRSGTLICGIAAAMVLGISGCAENVGENTAKAAEAEVLTTAGAEPESGNVDEGTTEREQTGREETVELVGIKAHVKEISDNTLLISSDTDDFPGVFTVVGAEGMPEFPDLKGGTSIQI